MIKEYIQQREDTFGMLNEEVVGGGMCRAAYCLNSRGQGLKRPQRSSGQSCIRLKLDCMNQVGKICSIVHED